MFSDTPRRASVHWTAFVPALVLLVLSVGAATVVLSAASYPIPTTLPCWVVATAGPLTLFYLALLWNERSRELTTHGLRWLAWMPFPVIVIAVVTLLMLRIPFRSAFSRSQSDLEAEAKRLLASPAEPDAQWGNVERRLFRRTIGVYEVGGVDIDRQRGHVFFFIGAGIRGLGLVYLRDPEERYDDTKADRDLPTNWQRFAYP